MRSRARGRATAVLAVALFAAARGGPSPARADGPGTQVSGTIENDKEKPISRLTLKGSLPKWPDGAVAFVKFFVNQGPDIDWYRLEVKDGVFEGTFTLPKRTAPMKYRAELWLNVLKQAPAIKRWFQREFAVSATHSEVVDVRDVNYGTPEEQRKFRADLQKKLTDLLDRVRAHVEKVIDGIAKAATPDWAQLKGPLGEENQKLLKEYSDMNGEFVTLGREFPLISQINQASVAAWQMLQNAEKDPSGGAASTAGRRAVENATNTLERLKTELASEQPEEKPKDGGAPGAGH
jgi:hypothetical protein